MFCGEGSLVKRLGREVTIYPLYCRSWNCSTCGPRRKRQLIDQFCAGRPDTFITLTVNPAFGKSPEDRARLLADAWRVIVRKAGKMWRNGKIAYGCVYEATKKGEPHLHILARSKWIGQRWLSDQMRTLIEAPNVDIRRVGGARQIAQYVSKYVGKAPQRFGSCKRYWFTQDWDVLPVDPEREELRRQAEWEVRPEGQYAYALSFDGGRWFMDWFGDVCVLTPRPPPLSKGYW